MGTKRGKLICFSGMDGTGKTTQAKRLTETLQSRGIKSQYVWNTYQPILIKPFITVGRALFFRRKDAFRDYAGYSQAKRGLFKNRFLGMVYEQLLYLDYWLQSIPQVPAPLLRGRTVVSDRYVYDAVVNQAIDLGYSEQKTRSRLHRLLRILPRPDLVFFLDAPEEVSFQRKSDIPAIDHLKNRRSIYLKLARESGAMVIDGSKPVEEVEAQVHVELKRFSELDRP